MCSRPPTKAPPHRLCSRCGHAARLSREQKSRFVATAWTAQMFKHFEDPKPGYVADWPDLPEWQQETDADIFRAVEDAVG
ncbi:hypothetical protein DQ392_15730 [Streptomyces reniochalinae]|uniref:Uncharacterized protein n=1 Tax=Streptomyces reniochalinae TaxID=2250578 RepID=A0A367EJ15_9ACTN|nr:hypothetical protein DQ392_15730 [Streptomyces reniochalinae]